MDSEEKVSFSKNNRFKKTSPKRGLFWCGSCDHAIVGEGQKCPYCHVRHKTRRRKKQNLVE